jgi:hypothetical protein
MRKGAKMRKKFDVVNETIKQSAIYDDNKDTEAAYRKILLDKLDRNEPLESEEIHFLMVTKPKKSNTEPRTLKKPTERIGKVTAKNAKRVDTWEVMKQVADKDELNEMKKIEEKNMKPKDKKSYIAAQALLDNQIKAAHVRANEALFRKEPEREELKPPPPKQPDPAVNEGLGKLIKQFDLKKMKTRLMSSPKEIKYKY